MANWYYHNESGEKIGPITGKELKQLVQQETVTQETFVEDPDGRTGLAKDVKGLTFPETVQPLSEPFTAVPPKPMSANPFGTAAPSPAAQSAQSTPSASPFAISAGHVPPHHGGTQSGYQNPGHYLPREESPGFFDFGFTRFVTNTLISIIWVLTVVLTLPFWGIMVLVGLYNMAQAQGEFDFAIGLLTILLSTFSAVFGLLFTRIILELIIVMFRIETNTRTLKEWAERVGEQSI